MANDPVNVDPFLADVLKRILKEFRVLSDCQSTGIRLQSNGDYPYYVYEGFPEFFILKENSLCVRDAEGKVALDRDGAPLLECMCGNVLKRRFNPKFSFFTNDGCFWTNSTTRLLSTPVEEERRVLSKTRGMCYRSGYESVALIPMETDDKVVGLIQLNDPREDMFTAERVGAYKLMADHAGAVVLKAIGVTEGMSQIRDIVSRFKDAGS